MTRVGVLAVLLLAAGVAAPAAAQPRGAADTVTRRITIPADAPVLVRIYASWRADCTSRGDPAVATDEPPQHGTVSTRPGTSTIQEYIGDGSRCVGREVPGTAVWFQPAPGFHGTDRFGLTITTASRVFHDIILVTVR